MACQYKLPAEAKLKGKPNAQVLSGIEYGCVTCGCTMNNANTLKEHIQGAKHKKAIENAALKENATITQNITKYAELEKKHREAGKDSKKEKFKEKLEKISAEKASMSKEDYKKLLEDRKRKREEAGQAPHHPKKQKVEPFTCGACDAECNATDQIMTHFGGQKHAKKLKQYEGGCWLCAVPPPATDGHFEGKKHLHKVKDLQDRGIDISQLNVMSVSAVSNVPKPVPKPQQTQASGKKAGKAK